MSSGSESDDDYIPGEPEKLSEEESADEETEKQYDNEQEIKTKKRKASQERTTKTKRKTRNNVEEESETEKVIEDNELLDPEEQKKKDEDLWAMFLDGTDTKPKKPIDEAKPDTAKPVVQIEKKISNDVKKNEDSKAKERRIFEFAGETIVVEDNVIKEKVKTGDRPVSELKNEVPNRANKAGGSGALSSVLGSLNKKGKLSTLEKSKLDWMTYKKDEDIEEEIQSHNKGKAGYLDRRDFLERADLRQYEIERDLRMSRRSNR